MSATLFLSALVPKHTDETSSWRVPFPLLTTLHILSCDLLLVGDQIMVNQENDLAQITTIFEIMRNTLRSRMEQGYRLEKLMISQCANFGDREADILTAYVGEVQYLSMGDDYAGEMISKSRER